MTRDKATIKRLKMYKGGGKRCVVLAVWWAKLEENDKIRHMTQIASLLLFLQSVMSSQRGGAYT